MTILNMYSEYSNSSKLPSMKTFFEEKPYVGIERIIKYLESGVPTFATAGLPFDFFTGERIPGYDNGMTDGEYAWMSTLSYYVRKYNLRLPKEFENKVLAQ